MVNIVILEKYVDQLGIVEFLDLCSDVEIFVLFN